MQHRRNDIKSYICTGNSICNYSRGGVKGAHGGCAPPLFCRHVFLCSHFEEAQTVLIDVKLIINNVPLIYVYPITIKTCLRLNHLLFSRQLLYSCNTRWTVVRNLTVLSSTTDNINYISNHFWGRWRHEYVVNLYETQRTSKLNINSPKIILC